MKTSTTFLIFALLLSTFSCKESAENVHISGSFRVAAEGEVIPKSSGIEQEHPFFQLEGMKIARAYLDRQYAKERAQREQQFGV